MSDADRRRDGRFAVLRFSLHVEHHPTEDRALRRLFELEPFERVGLVDRETGHVRCRRDQMPMVVEKLEQAGTAPAELIRTGSLGDYLKMKPQKAGGPDRPRGRRGEPGKR